MEYTDTSETSKIFPKKLLRMERFKLLIIPEYTAMVQRLMYNYYTGVTHYTTSTFLRMKLGDALQKRNVAPHICETREEAQIALGKTT